MKNTLFTLFVILSAGIGQRSEAQTELKYTGSYPGTYGLSITNEIYQAGSDAASAEFQDTQVPFFNQFINENLREYQALSDASAVSLNPANIGLAEASSVRVYFLAEGAGYHNTLGLTTVGPTGTSSSELIFPDGSSISSNILTGDTQASLSLRTSSNPLLPGDFVDLGTFDAGSQLDFFLIANGANGGTYRYSSNAESNPDLMHHIVTYAIPGSPYLLVAFEDLYQLGDQDYNDMIFVVDVGSVANVNALLSNPEPGTVILFSGIGALLFYLERKRSRVLVAQ